MFGFDTVATCTPGTFFRLEFYCFAESNVCILYVYRALEDRRSHYEPSHGGPPIVDDLDDHELYVPHFQRVSISGEDTSGVSNFSLTCVFMSLVGSCAFGRSV